MQTMNPKNALIGICVVVALSGAVGRGDEKSVPTPLKVLIDSSDPSSGWATGMQRLLERHGLAVTIRTWPAHAPERVKEFDVVIVMGRSLTRGGGSFPRAYEIPVLGCGQFGCDYFGQQALKNGAPYT